jgi:4'-phosphopantetheinyl transferase
VNALPSVVDVVWAHPHGTARAAALLDGREREHLARLRRASDRARYVAAHALLRLVVARRWGIGPSAVDVTATCARCRGPHGRPTVTPPSGRGTLHVSIAHAGDRVLVAATDLGPVGVDVEVDSCADFAGFDDVSLAESERRELAGMPVGQQLSGRTRMWVQKEAVLKATGDGLSMDPRQVIVSPPPQPPRLVAWRDGSVDPSLVHLTELALGSGYAACAALLGPRTAPVRLRNGDELLLIA